MGTGCEADGCTSLDARLETLGSFYQYVALFRMLEWLGICEPYTMLTTPAMLLEDTIKRLAGTALASCSWFSKNTLHLHGSTS